jgi:hypothetical protein
MELPYHILLCITEKCSIKGLSNLANSGNTGYGLWNDANAWKHLLKHHRISYERIPKYPYSWKRSIDYKIRKDQELIPAVLATNISVQSGERILECVLFEDGSVECLVDHFGRFNKVSYESIPQSLRVSTDENPCYEGIRFKNTCILKNRNMEFGPRHNRKLARQSNEYLPELNKKEYVIDGRWTMKRQYPFTLTDWITKESFHIDIPDTFKIQQLFTGKSSDLNQGHFAFSAEYDGLTFFLVYSRESKIFEVTNLKNVILTAPHFRNGKCISVGIITHNNIIDHLYQIEGGCLFFVEIESQRSLTQPIVDIYTDFPQKLYNLDNLLVVVRSSSIVTFRTDKSFEMLKEYNIDDCVIHKDNIVEWRPKTGDMVIRKHNGTSFTCSSFPVYFGRVGADSGEIVSGSDCVLIKTEKCQYTLIEF